MYIGQIGFSEGGFSNFNAGQFWTSVGIGAATGLVSGGIAMGMGSITNALVGTVSAPGYIGKLALCAGLKSTLTAATKIALGILASRKDKMPVV